ncbi:hypothetical protein B0H13DRAFT_2445288 [Mycena leptocephala]|nr:hypothetical protein B0H13DRAFT_2445288 [Mycena leptocephala]
MVLQRRTCGNPADAVPWLRAFKASTGDHFETTSAAEWENPSSWRERDQAVGTGLTFEGIAGYVYTDSTCGASPLYRLYQIVTGDHMYSMNAAEINTVVKTQNYNFEGLQCFIFPM